MAIYRMNVHFYCDRELEVEADSVEKAIEQIGEQAREYPIYAKDLYYDIDTEVYEVVSFE